MRKKLITVGALAAAAYAVREWIMPPFLLKQVAQPATVFNGKQEEKATSPRAETIWIPSAGGRLQGRMVKADPVGDVAVLVFHSGVEHAAEWAPAQELLRQRGVSSLVFDYAGFGESDGDVSLGMFHDDPLNAYETFRAYLPPETRICLLGHGLGVPVLAHAFADYDQSAVHSVVLHGGPSTFRAQAVINARVPELLAQIALPQVFDTLANIGRVTVPTLVVHSKDDQVNPLYMAYEIYSAAAQPKRLLELEGPDHFAPLRGEPAFWNPVVEFLGAAEPEAV